MSGKCGEAQVQITPIPIVSTINTNNDICTTNLGYGQSCNLNEQCQTFNGLICSNGSCKCALNYNWTGTKCAKSCNVNSISLAKPVKTIKAYDGIELKYVFGIVEIIETETTSFYVITDNLNRRSKF